jgi:hypothetical protein
MSSRPAAAAAQASIDRIVAGVAFRNDALESARQIVRNARAVLAKATAEPNQYAEALKLSLDGFEGKMKYVEEHKLDFSEITALKSGDKRKATEREEERPAKRKCISREAVRNASAEQELYDTGQSLVGKRVYVTFRTGKEKYGKCIRATDKLAVVQFDDGQVRERVPIGAVHTRT